MSPGDGEQHPGHISNAYAGERGAEYPRDAASSLAVRAIPSRRVEPPEASAAHRLEHAEGALERVPFAARHVHPHPGIPRHGAGGAVLAMSSLVHGDAWPAHVSVASAVSLVHLCVLGSIAAYSALTYLLRTERPSLATSYAFVNPVVALVLGAMFGGEHAAAGDWAGVILVIAAVALVASAASATRTSR